MTGGTRLDVSVVLPTYNESASLPVLVPRIVAALEAAAIRGEIIVVDDNSPDHTAEVALELGQTYPVRVQKRVDERGLGTAVTAGFRMSEAEVCVVMDADGSHPVEALGGMVRMILEDKAEIVVGSRHVAGGGSQDWPLFSQLKSRFAASLAVGLTSMTDPTTGFMAIRRSRLETLMLDPVGWKIVLETVVKAHPARLAEVPIVFTDREHGESKQSLRVLGQYLEHLYKLYKFRFPGFVEFLKFCVVGVLGVVVDLSVVSSLKLLLAMDTRLCQVFGFSAAVTFNYAVNRRFSFERARETPLIASFVTYVGTNLVGLTLRMLVIQLLISVTNLDRGHGYLLLSVIGIALATLVNFVGVKYFAFAPERLRGLGEARDDEPNLEHTGPGRKGALVIAALSLSALIGANLLLGQDRTHDERVNLVMAENIRAGFEGLVHPSVTPGFPREWQRDALPSLGNTPIYPLILAAAPAGRLGLSLVTFAVLGLFFAGSFLALSRIDRGAAQATLMLLASTPWVLAQFSLLEFEPLVAALTALGFALLVRSEGPRRDLYALAAGLVLGLGFATKMWLVLPGVLASAGWLVTRTYASERAERGPRTRAAALASVGFLLGASSHLAFVALTSPADLRAWLDWVYLGIFSGRGVSGPKLSGVGAEHGVPFSAWAYAIWLVRDHGALLAPIALGLPAATRRLSRVRRAWVSAVLFALAALVPLSVPAIKEPLYMAPVLPFIYMLAGLAVVAPDRTPVRYVRVNRGAARASLVIAALLMLGWLVALVSDATLHWPDVTLHLAHVAIWTVPSVLVLYGRPVAPAILPCALASIALAAVRMLAGTRGLPL